MPPASIYLVIATLCLFASQAVPARDTPSLRVEARIELPDTRGRIDHLAHDVEGQRLFVAELGNHSVDVVDLEARRVMHRIAPLDEPQGIAWSADTGLLYVACGGDGTLRAFRGNDFVLARSADVGEDADNVRLDASAQRLYVGYGAGALGVVDAATLAPVAVIRLKGHPESFQLAPGNGRLLVNVPGAHQVAVADRATSRQTDTWSTGKRAGNYPMAIDTPGNRVLVVFRQPPGIVAYRLSDGTIAGEAPVCGDADDLFVDERRDRIYVICGEGRVDILDRKSLARLDTLVTAPGARTGLYSPEADRLFIAVRAQGDVAASVWILAPVQ